MDCWTPEMRDEFVRHALSTADEKGNRNQYWFNKMPKHTRPDEENPKRSAATQALMTTVFSKPEYRVFALKFYDILINKITSNQYTRGHFMKNIVVMLKGGTSYTFLLGACDDEVFPFSDLDVVIYINPNLSRQTFNTIKETLNILVLQTISQYKRAIDFMFFSNKERMSAETARKQGAEQFISDAVIASFKEDYNAALAACDIPESNGIFISPFESNEIRNAASKYSFIIDNSTTETNSVVRVELPHFEMCERIPLKKTPMFCSHNRTINFNRVENNEDTVPGRFDLYRIRFNNLFLRESEDENKKSFRENVTADFIDITISSQEDAELIDFWQHGRTLMVNDEGSNIWLCIPDADTMLSDLYKMLNVYECPEGKKEKRQKRYDMLKQHIDSPHKQPMQ